ncbi:MAG: hypothetical protein ACP5SH_11850 [Syntrophobacteraceae bacterium]
MRRFSVKGKMMAGKVHGAQLVTYEDTQQEKANEEMDKIFSDPLLDMIEAETPGSEASRRSIAAYLKKYRFLATIECGKCGELNYEGETTCSRCGKSLTIQPGKKRSPR